MRIRIVLAAAATVLIAACGDATTSAPSTLQPGDRSSNTIACRSGYHIATRADGTQYCEPDEPDFAASSTSTRP